MSGQDNAQEKALVSDDVLDRSVQENLQFTQIPGVNDAFVLQMSTVADDILPWGRDVWRRDRELRKFWPTEPYVASAINTVVAARANMSWSLDGPPRTVGIMQRMLQSSNLGDGWLALQTQVAIDLLCLAGPTKVHLGGERRGQTKSIRDIVKDEDVGPVLSIGNNGVLVERHINQWHKTPLGNRKWWWISLKNASSHSGKRDGGIFLTEDHPVLTAEKGWLWARDVKPGMLVATGDPDLSEHQKEALTGGLLGDVGIGVVSKRAMLRMSHSIKQEDWLNFKQDIFSGFDWTGRNYHEKEDGTTVGVNSRSSLALKKWRDDWYPKGQKRIPREYIEKYFSPRMLAVWYCDDGSLHRGYTRAGNETTPHGSLYTCGFTKSDTEWLAGFLSAKGIPCRVYKQNGKQKTYYKVHITNEGMRQLANYIGAYVPPFMRYKLPENAPAYNPANWEIDSAVTYFDVVHRSEQRDYKSGYHTAKTTFHIGVEETRNFVAANTAVHNTQDNGAFVEIIRQDDKPNSPVLNLNHLDSGRCVRTGMQDYPVIYYSRLGKEHKLAWYQVLTFEDMPSPIEEMNGVQYCFLTRILRGAQILRDISVYKREKLSGRNPGEIHLVSGVQTKLVEDKLEVAHEHATNAGFARYMLPVVLGSLDPNASVSAVTIALKSLPDGFDEDTTLRWYISLLAMGAGADYQDFAPLPSGNIGTGQQSEILHRKARGKGHTTWRKLWEHKLNFFGILPQSVDFSFDEKDIESDIQDAELNDKKAKTYSTYYDKGSGVLPLNVIHQMMADDGILRPEYLSMLGEQDETTDIVATDTERAPTEVEIEEASQPAENTEEMSVDEIPLETRAKDNKNDINYGWAGLNMPTWVSLLALGIGASIDKGDLHEAGIEDESHVTVKYGFEDGVTPGMCADKVAILLPVTVKLGKFSLFENDEFDVLKVEVESEKLRMMNKKLSELPNADTHPQYNPHMTIAYLKPGTGEKYLDMPNPFDGRYVQIDELQFSDKNENKTTIQGLKKNKQIVDDVSTFEDEFQALSEEALSGDVSQAEFLDEAGILVAQQIILAFLEGSGKTINQLTDDDREIIQQQTEEQLGYLPEYYNAVLGFSENEEPDVNIANRVTMWGSTILGIYALGQLHHENEEQRLQWILGPTDHCGDCLQLSTVVRTRKEWRESNWRPRSRRLECRGYRCLCMFAETDKPIQGSFP